MAIDEFIVDVRAHRQEWPQIFLDRRHDGASHAQTRVPAVHDFRLFESVKIRVISVITREV